MALFSVPKLNFLSFYVDFATIVKYTTGSLCKGATSLILASLNLINRIKTLIMNFGVAYTYMKKKNVRMNSSGVDQST